MRPDSTAHAAAMFFGVLTTGLLVSGCAGLPENFEPGPIIGCHYFVQDQAAVELQLPWGIRLMEDSLTGWPALQQRDGVRRASTLTGTAEVDIPFGYWIRTATDSVEIGYPGGGGLLLELAVADTMMRGVVRPVGDALPPPAVAPAAGDRLVTLVWAGCPTER